MRWDQPRRTCQVSLDSFDSVVRLDQHCAEFRIPFEIYFNIISFGFTHSETIMAKINLCNFNRCWQCTASASPPGQGRGRGDGNSGCRLPAMNSLQGMRHLGATLPLWVSAWLRCSQMVAACAHGAPILPQRHMAEACT